MSERPNGNWAGVLMRELDRQRSFQQNRNFYLDTLSAIEFGEIVTPAQMRKLVTVAAKLGISAEKLEGQIQDKEETRQQRLRERPELAEFMPVEQLKARRKNPEFEADGYVEDAAGRLGQIVHAEEGAFIAWDDGSMTALESDDSNDASDDGFETVSNGLGSYLKGAAKRTWARGQAARALKSQLRAEAKAARMRDAVADASARAKKNPLERNVAEGFWRGGRFHPIRTAADYDREKAGEPDDGIYSARGRKAAALARRRRNPDTHFRREIEALIVQARKATAQQEFGEAAAFYRAAVGLAEEMALQEGVNTDALQAALQNKAAEAKRNARQHYWQHNPPLHPLAAFSAGASGLLSALQIREKLKKPKSKTRKRNPDGAAGLYESFQGRPSTEKVQMAVSKHAPNQLAQLGDLVEVMLTDGRILQFGRKVNGKTEYPHKLCAHARGRLWITGGPIARRNPDLKSNALELVSPIKHVVYRSFKPHLGDRPNTHYIHTLGEESGIRPELGIDNEGFPVIHGGAYTIESRGIVD